MLHVIEQILARHGVKNEQLRDELTKAALSAATKRRQLSHPLQDSLLDYMQKHGENGVISADLMKAFKRKSGSINVALKRMEAAGKVYIGHYENSPKTKSSLRAVWFVGNLLSARREDFVRGRPRPTKAKPAPVVSRPVNISLSGLLGANE